MKMSEENYKKLKWFFDYTVENAGDQEMEYIFWCLSTAARIADEKTEEEKQKNKKLEA